MPKTISIFNNKGGVGKTTICWNLAHHLGEMGEKVLLVDFDPQCNLSIAVLGEDGFSDTLPKEETPYGTTIRSFLQHFLQNTDGEEVFTHEGPHTSENVDLVAGDFWLNIYADSLSVGNDLLTGSGLSKYIALDAISNAAEEKNDVEYDYVLVDLPPSFSTIVRAAFYSSDYYVVPCTSDNFSVYCVGLIGEMVPNFVNDWQNGLDRFKSSNPHLSRFDDFGSPVFAGWIFNGFDTARERRSSAEVAAGVPMKEKQIVRADQTMHDHVVEAIEDDLVGTLRNQISEYDPVSSSLPQDYRIGDMEDANVLIQNSLWLNVPLGDLDQHDQVTDLRDRASWADNQLEQIDLFNTKFDEAANRIVSICN